MSSHTRNPRLTPEQIALSLAENLDFEYFTEQHTKNKKVETDLQALRERIMSEPVNYVIPIQQNSNSEWYAAISAEQNGPTERPR